MLYETLRQGMRTVDQLNEFEANEVGTVDNQSHKTKLG